MRSEKLVSDSFILLQSEVRQLAQPMTGEEPPQRHHFDPTSAPKQLLVRDLSPVAPHSTEQLVQFDQSVHPARTRVFKDIMLIFYLRQADREQETVWSVLRQGF